MPRTRQEIFDHVAQHLLTQYAQAFGSVCLQACAYRAPDGLCCAVGCLIPPELYDAKIEGTAVRADKVSFDADCLSYNSSNLRKVLRKLDLYNNNVLPLLKVLQRVHDGNPVDLWPGLLRTVARDYGLSAAVVDQHSQTN